jgi:hypothetical protein
MAEIVSFQTSINFGSIRMYILKNFDEQVYIDYLASITGYSNVRKIESNFDTELDYLTARDLMKNQFKLKKDAPDCIYALYYNRNYGSYYNYYFFNYYDVFKFRTSYGDYESGSYNGSIINSLNMGPVTSQSAYVISRVVFEDRTYSGNWATGYLRLEQREKGYVLVFPTAFEQYYDEVGGVPRNKITFSYFTMHYADVSEEMLCCLAQCFGITE